MYSPTTQSQYIPNSVLTGMPSCEGRKSIKIIIDFSLGLQFDLDLTAVQQQLQWIRSVQTLYVDNLANTSPVTITMGVTLQRITFPARTQGYIPILQPNPPVVRFQNTLPNTVNIQVLNFFLPPYMWGNGNQYDINGYLQVSDVALDAIIAAGALNVRTQPTNILTPTNNSGTITLGGTAQTLFVANASRKRFIISNPVSATEVLQFMLINAAGGRIDLAAGMTWDESGVTVDGSAVLIIAATTGHAFTAYEFS